MNDVAVRVDDIKHAVASNGVSAAAGSPPNQSIGCQFFVGEEDHITGHSERSCKVPGWRQTNTAAQSSAYQDLTQPLMQLPLQWHQRISVQVNFGHDGFCGSLQNGSFQS